MRRTFDSVCLYALAVPSCSSVQVLLTLTSCTSSLPEFSADGSERARIRHHVASVLFPKQVQSKGSFSTACSEHPYSFGLQTVLRSAGVLCTKMRTSSSLFSGVAGEESLSSTTPFLPAPPTSWRITKTKRHGTLHNKPSSELPV